jgi:hypothetical protein
MDVGLLLLLVCVCVCVCVCVFHRGCESVLRVAKGKKRTNRSIYATVSRVNGIAANLVTSQTPTTVFEQQRDEKEDAAA